MLEEYRSEYAKDVFYDDNGESVIYDIKDEFKSLLGITKKDSNLMKLEKYYDYEICKSHDNDSIDCDVCELSSYVYKNVYGFLKGFNLYKQYSKNPFYVYNHKYQLKSQNDSYEYYRGDTMTSFKWIKKHYEKYFKGNRNIDVLIEELAKLYHTIGNMIPVPLGFNVNRASNPGRNKGANSEFDFWDLAMMKIKEYCESGGKNDPLKELLKKDYAVNACEKWLSYFNKDWNTFIEGNHLGSFVTKEKGTYQIIQFWKGHSFENPGLPDNEEEFKEFLVFLNKAIYDRNVSVLRKLKEII